MNLNDSISVVLGVGPQRVKVLNDLGVENIKDMLYYFPRRYLDRTTLTLIKDLKKGDQVTLISKVETLGERRIRRGTMFQIIASDGTGLLTLNWFNGVRYVKNLFKVGDKLAISGKVEWYNGFSITHPEIEKLRDDEDPLKTGKVVPIYPLTQELRSVGLDQRGIRKILGMIVSELNPIFEIMPEAIIKENDLIFLDKALRDIHFSKNLSELRSATKRLKFDEHLFAINEVDERYYLSDKVSSYVLSAGTKNFKTRTETDLKIARPLLQSMHKMHRAGVDNYVTHTGRIRKLTPRECLRLMGFRDDFKIVVSNTQLYRQAGNSIVVDVLIALLKKIDITKYGKDLT